MSLLSGAASRVPLLFYLKTDRSNQLRKVARASRLLNELPLIQMVNLKKTGAEQALTFGST